ncbi:hypothetical protein GobsT_63360 [Gemmata obscuriglobus]|uniref:Uncharacterized protein n=1 Tax=Gemmata obscuriglobus TaxID=114 RepID=A0A2Z3H4K4_9BACT|nr:hypothetical protein [Gemmata obscuriglobus]AWM35930.1 hypothetical protein C1280_02145 [Gemmata obscuriglobus]QEG31514.1 hypothetical protein GobsT_63360 [Gemmata obscuriglobus]VTS10856.1 Uncharacterized protein OS=Singulisphaera acidiphila (strain ATCC BAA-1392 / DSM 18658 / VKM B-2454 / MOB10) GN=Sinac_0545 PE=4 SV=1 [Gemmata obscuriglobus UQM 2246]
MCVAIALALSELPTTLVEGHGLTDRVHKRGGEPEVRFYYRATPTLLPVWWNGRLQVVRWGNKDRRERMLPPTGWTWKETVEEGKWAALEPEPVLVPTSFGMMNGVWYKVKVGLRGLLVRDQAGAPVVYLITEPATRYYGVMCSAEWMPVLEGQVI